MTQKPPLGIEPRHFWLKNRIRDCISALQRLEETEDWGLYLKQSLALADEIQYAANEWENYYLSPKYFCDKCNIVWIECECDNDN